MSYVNKTQAEIRTELMNKAADPATGLGKLNNLNTGSVLRGLLELFAWGFYQVYSFFNDVLKQAFPATATGGWLDLHAAGVGLSRHAAKAAEGIVVFTRNGTAGNLLVPKGTIVKTALDAFGNEYRYTVSADTIIPAGAVSANVAVRAELPGSVYNVAAGAITVAVSSVQGITSIANPVSWLTLEGSEAEADDALRLRCELQWAKQSGITAAYYEALALSVGGVLQVWIDENWPRGRGTVDIYIAGSAGLPTVGLLAAVSAVVNDKRNKPCTDDVLVESPVAVNIAAITVTVEAAPGYTGTAWLAAAATAVLNALLYQGSVAGVQPLRVGEDFLRGRAEYELMRITDAAGARPVRRVVWTAPVSDVAVMANGLAKLTGAVAVTVTVAAEI